MNKNKKISYLFLTSIFLCGSFFVFDKECQMEPSSVWRVASANSEEVSHLVISEIQISGESVYDEFIELYNPTNLEINLSGWDLKRKTESGNESNVLNNIEGVISAYGYFLIIPRANCGESKTEDCYKGAVATDDEYTTNSFLAKDNTILLYDGDGNLVDKVGWGSAVDFEGEVISINPENNQSLERVNINSVIQDVDNNKNDFVLRDNLEPRNSNNDGNDSEQEGSIQENGANGGGDQETDSDSEQEDSTQETGNSNETEDSEFFKDSESDDNQNNDDANDTNRTNDIILKIIITEFLPNPEDSDRDNEFIEIYNDGGAEVDLSGWTLEDKAGRIKKFSIPDGTEISAGKYKVFYSDETKITLNNSGDGVVLRDYENNIIDETPICDSVQEEQSYALDKNGSWVLTLRPTPRRKNIIKAEEKNEKKDSESSKDSESDDNQNNNSGEQNGSTALWDYGAGDIQNGSACENGANSELRSETDSGYDYSDRIVVSEVYPNPFGRDNREGNYEWIELYNNSDEDVNLKGWQIDDIFKKGSKAYIIKEDKIIKARGFAVFENIQTKIMLNNSGDEVNILWPGGEVVDSLKYEKANEGVSYSWTPNSWVWSSEITPGKNNKAEAVMIGKKLSKNDLENNLEQGFVTGVENAEDESDEIEDIEIDYMETDIKDIKHFTKYSRVKVSGIVSTPPGIFTDNTFYLLGSGIQVYSYEAKIPKIELGDKIEITGRVSEVGGEKRILLDNKKDLKIISRNNLVVSELILTGNINESVEGYLAMIEGKVSQIEKDIFFLDDGSGEIKVYIKPQTNIKKPEIKIGDWMVIIGQVSQTSAGYRILPRFQGDLKLSRVSGAVKASDVFGKQGVFEENKRDNFLLYGIIGMIGLIILINWIRIRIKK